MAFPRAISKIPIHYYGGVVFLCKDRKCFTQAYKHLHGEDYPENPEDAAGLTCEDAVNKDGYAVFLVGVFDKNQSTILHEVVHLVLFIQKRASINPLDDRGEATAHMIEHFYSEFTKKLNKQPKKKKVIIQSSEINDNDVKEIPLA